MDVSIAASGVSPSSSPQAVKATEAATAKTKSAHIFNVVFVISSSPLLITPGPKPLVMPKHHAPLTGMQVLRFKIIYQNLRQDPPPGETLTQFKR